MTREVAGKTRVSLECPADQVHNPKQFTYADGMKSLEDRDNLRQELEKIEVQALSDLTKRTNLKKMLPTDLKEDLEKDRSLKTWEDAWKYVNEQVPLWKDWKAPKKKGGSNDKDVDLAENGEQGDDDPPGLECPPCGDLDTFKGGGKGGQFQGYCGFCNTRGHKKADCRKYTAHLQAKGKAGKKGDDGKGKGKDKGQSYSGGGGGWQTKGGGQSYSKGGYRKKGAGFEGFAYNIDAEDGWGQGQASGGDNSYIFMLAKDDAESASNESGDELYGFDEERFPTWGKDRRRQCPPKGRNSTK